MDANMSNEKVSKKLLFNRDLLQKFIAFGGLIVLVILFSVLSNKFLRPDNLITVMLQTSIIALIAIGESFVIITSGIDLSVGSVLGLIGIITTLLMSVHYPMWVSVVIGLLCGALIGYINGFIIDKGGVAPFIVTLGMLSIARGAALVLTGGIPVSGLPDSFNIFGNYNLFGWLPMPVIIMIVIALIFSAILSKTKVGRYTYALGSNEEAARLSGINVGKVKRIVYTISGFLSGLAGIILASRLFTGQPTAGTGYELNAVAAVVIGGASLMGGEGTILGTIIGALIMGVLSNGLNLLNVTPFWQQIVIGAVIVATVYVDKLRNKKS
ncbi:ABC transporter permease [Thermoanaerobacterium thermosaccharolyticum]|uniref:ABC transporter permease n=1 Tax=Thermoanaerobacterium thermosaccharolyticum TaxID=1517 RepID=UPI0020A5325B|nr:ABC transporter permease [Thermoanaerobacterium thermosaccharolyticum]MCP2240324.1 ribose transport system permease protein [Thermoanaerobacterium thermosaccharolyticum]